MTNVINQDHGKNWTLYNGDSCEVIQGIPDNSVDFVIYSPPFEGLFLYSNSSRDMGNSRNSKDFTQHYRFLSQHLYRILKPGRLMAVHCMLLPSTIQHNGYIGLRDFRGDLIRTHQADGFIFHSECVIWKDPVTAMQRTKSIGLLYKQLKKDSALSRQGIPDYLDVFRKPGINSDPITKDPDEFPVDLWQRYASPVWFDINPSNTLQKESAREQADEKHICPLQLDVIERPIQLWTNPNDIVFSPFAGIGSEVYQAVKMGRKGIGIELKPSYYRQAVLNCQRAEQEAGTRTLFDLLDEMPSNVFQEAC